MLTCKTCQDSKAMPNIFRSLSKAAVCFCLFSLMACQGNEVKSDTEAGSDTRSMPDFANLPSVKQQTDSGNSATNPHQVAMAAGSTNPHQVGSQGAAPHADGFATGADRKQVSWTLPAGWTEVAPTSMRLGNFLYTHKNGQKVEITVASLPGEAGGYGANFGMWRSQIALPALNEAEVMKQSEELKVGDLTLRMVDLVSTENVIDGKLKAHITGAIHKHQGNTWFFKMKGEDEAVRSSKEAFMEFLKSFKFNA